MDNFVVPDFETRSTCDLKKCGAWVYAYDPTTEPLCMGYSINGEPAEMWMPGEPFPEKLLQAMKNRYWFVAHNVGFERAMWERVMVPRYGWPEMPVDLWYDTIASCAYRSIPLKLELAARVLDLPHQKLKSNPRWFTPDKKGNFADFLTGDPDGPTYCLGDINTQVALHRRLGQVTKRELGVWRLDQIINSRGVTIDIPFVKNALKVVKEAEAPLKKEFAALTGGLAPGQIEKVLGWCNEQGVRLPNLQKETLNELLGSDEEEDDDDAIGELAYAGSNNILPHSVTRALTIRRILGSASIKKLERMLHCVDYDGRVRGLLQYHGANTGRWAGRLLQPQNFPRPTLAVEGLKKIDPDDLVAAIMTGDYEYVEAIYGGDAVSAVASSLRHALVAGTGKSLVVGDFSTVEARVVLALSGQWDKVDLLASGGDPYISMAEEIFQRKGLTKEKNPEERQIGKNSVLGLGFQMGWRKFLFRYAKDKDEDFCKHVVSTYREEWAPEVPRLWAGLEEAALRTIQTGRAHEAYGIRYKLIDGFMTARLPSGRLLWYYNPHPIMKALPWDMEHPVPAWAFNSFKYGQWQTVDAYGGMLTANVVQATARDLLVSAMYRCEEHGLPSVLTVHDENVTEVDDAVADADYMEEIMCETPAWAKDLHIPISAECWAGKRYRK